MSDPRQFPPAGMSVQELKHLTAMRMTSHKPETPASTTAATVQHQVTSMKSTEQSTSMLAARSFSDPRAQRRYASSIKGHKAPMARASTASQPYDPPTSRPMQAPEREQLPAPPPPQRATDGAVLPSALPASKQLPTAESFGYNLSVSRVPAESLMPASLTIQQLKELTRLRLLRESQKGQSLQGTLQSETPAETPEMHPEVAADLRLRAAVPVPEAIPISSNAGLEQKPGQTARTSRIAKNGDRSAGNACAVSSPETVIVHPRPNHFVADDASDSTASSVAPSSDDSARLAEAALAQGHRSRPPGIQVPHHPVDSGHGDNIPFSVAEYVLATPRSASHKVWSPRMRADRHLESACVSPGRSSRDRSSSPSSPLSPLARQLHDLACRSKRGLISSEEKARIKETLAIQNTLPRSLGRS